MRFSAQATESKGFADIEDWYGSEAGEQLLADLVGTLNPILATTFGYYSLQVGCPALSARLQETCRVKHQFTLSDSLPSAQVRANPSMLPVASDSVDLVILMHHLSSTNEPHAILREAFRTLIPEGKLVIIDFNPVSLWGLRRFFQGWLDHVPFRGKYYSAARIDDWMRLLGFDKNRVYRVGYLPPIRSRSLTRRLGWLEKAMRSWFPSLGALNLMVYSKSVSPLTPVRHRWVTRKLIPAKIARSGVGRNMKYDP